jgi:glycosyltransferase involved in cell wall biosynthesis
LTVKAINPVAAPQAFESLHYVGYTDDRGGIVSVIGALAAEPSLGVVMGVGPGFSGRRNAALRTMELPALEAERLGLGTLWRARGVAREVVRWIQGGGGRIFHGHSRAGLAVALWLNLMGEKRAVASVHCYGRQRWFYRWSSRRLGGRLFWLSPAMRTYYGAGGDAWEHCIPGCVPEAAKGARARGKAPGEPVRIGGIGALVPWKGWDLVLEAIARLPPEARDRIRFTQIGSGLGTPASRRYEAKLAERTAELGLGAIVEWRGEQPTSADFLGTIDCLVIASTREPFSIAMLEAMASGVPVLAANSGGAADAVIPGRTGWLFRTGDPADLCARLKLLAEGAPAMAAHPNPGDVDRFLAPVVARQWAAVYGAVLGGRGPERRF